MLNSTIYVTLKKWKNPKSLQFFNFSLEHKLYMICLLYLNLFPIIKKITNV